MTYVYIIARGAESSKCLGGSRSVWLGQYLPSQVVMCRVSLLFLASNACRKSKVGLNSNLGW